ncbi:tetraprenyl-beta-curcumene synthase family protein [Lederbergia citrea]|uniref:Tetraprenyl-beta-curcumene synthase family protein n=1 Tax=Lederbergia citrea TaxID=2833581 RepID=A0A942UQ17_9BACI|nr:tetraprenyl-beta-curcumene synthase family protein [Lederbergia citrea]MBS4175944.1 tetraprenyl-beta-curcumene synthase family protein [Lederbergia citrea]MBS4202504.1 tetraprenyl-beta-curcumene synthase family protein [Lederbergia citrea]MBS4222828.1 tetraprenyl-beta-curcumene synthase family protein [Lederbergia citrea]
MSLPSHPISLMNQVYRKIMPVVHKELSYWRSRAEGIPNAELRQQALASIEHKTFHCEGGAIMALTALDQKKAAIKFIVAYQTISDYLDNLCDRSTSLDPEDFAALHESMKDALSIGSIPKQYYRFRDDRDDGGYLEDLVETCQSVLKKVPHYEAVKPFLLELCQYYCDLQIHKHVCTEEREERLMKWFAQNKSMLPDMDWHEFSACSGSTLGIFCLISYALRKDFEEKHAEKIREGYFPYIQGLHILLDYFIDQDEDRAGGDLNFCFYYENEEQMLKRFIHFLDEADRHTKHLPDTKFHKLINRGLLGVYLSDNKVNEQKDVRSIAKKMMKRGGAISYFFYWNGRAYRRVQNLLAGSAKFLAPQR